MFDNIKPGDCFIRFADPNDIGFHDNLIHCIIINDVLEGVANPSEKMIGFTNIEYNIDDGCANSSSEYILTTFDMFLTFTSNDMVQTDASIYDDMFLKMIKCEIDENDFITYKK